MIKYIINILKLKFLKLKKVKKYNQIKKKKSFLICAVKDKKKLKIIKENLINIKIKINKYKIFYKI